MNVALTPCTTEPASASPLAATFDLEQAIREAAYASFEARGCESGHEMDDSLKVDALVQQANDGAAPTAH